MFRNFPGWQPQKCENHVALCRTLRGWIRREGTGKEGAGGGDSDASAHRQVGIFTFSAREVTGISFQEIFLDERSLFGFKYLEAVPDYSISEETQVRASLTSPG